MELPSNNRARGNLRYYKPDQLLYLIIFKIYSKRKVKNRIPILISFSYKRIFGIFV